MVSASYHPLELYRLIKRVVLKQTKEQYPFAGVHKQSLAMLNSKQGGLSNTQWHKRFNLGIKCSENTAPSQSTP
jgi:hypothetical protein